MAANKGLIGAKSAKKDEFYTRLEDIEKELYHYEHHFKGKKVLCNCDDPRVSNFVRYFVMSFEQLGLKKVTATCWRNTNPDLFSQGKEDHAVRLDWDGSSGPYHYEEDFSRIPCTQLEGDGDFRSDEVKALLDDSDIVVTNPPFSLFREYVTQLVESGKKFLIIGNQNAITYKEIFPLIMQNKMWLGESIHSGDRMFYVPDYYDMNAAGCGIDKEGNRFIRVKGVRWYTNLDIKRRHEHFESGSKYRDGSSYPHYDEYDAIEVSHTSDIPMDYDGVMGVPITFLDRYNPDEFEILGLDRYIADNPHPGRRFTIDGRETYARVLIRFRR